MRDIPQVEKQKFLRLFFLLIALIAIFQCTFSWLIFYFSRAEIKAVQNRFLSLETIQELAQSSENLTRMAQTYVITRDPIYRENYNQILAIRNGESPSPSNYDFFYWNENASKNTKFDVSPKPLIQRAEELAFTDEEFALFTQALEASNTLSILENLAMNAAEGKFDDGSGLFALRGPPNISLATQVLFDDHYWEEKQAIFVPIRELAVFIINRTETELHLLNKKMDWLMLCSRFLSIFAVIFMILVVVKAVRTLTSANKANETLLLNIFPKSIVKKLKEGVDPIADEYQASILFADIVDFTKSTYQQGPTKVVNLLNELFGSFDQLSEALGIEKVKTIGDNYMAAAGVPTPSPDHAAQLATFALSLKDCLARFNEKHDTKVQMRIGMDSGAIIAGVIGHKKSIYDVWGDVVNTASRMESMGVPGEIQITEKMALILQDRFLVEPREPFDVKGKGIMHTYILKGKKI